jgi:hypothetical protein
MSIAMRASEAVSSKPPAIVTCCTLVTARSCARQMHACVKSGRRFVWPPPSAAAAGFHTRRWPAVSPSTTWSCAARSASMPGLHARSALQPESVSPQRPARLHAGTDTCNATSDHMTGGAPGEAACCTPLR